MATMKRWSTYLGAVLTLALLPTAAPGGEDKKDAHPDAPVSYYKQIRPLFQAHCQGCHQPAKAGGGYIMTDFNHLLAKGDSNKPVIIPKKPTQGLLNAMITPKGGKAKMPQGKAPLPETDI